MPASYFRVAASVSDPVFMFGCFDAGHADLASDLDIGEAILRTRKPWSAMPAAVRHRHPAGASERGNNGFMFGVNTEQPAMPVLGGLVLGLWPTEQD